MFTSMADDGERCTSVSSNDSVTCSDSEDTIISHDGKRPRRISRKLPATYGKLRFRKNGAEFSDDQLQELRLKVNRRERQRMHDLNTAMESLREVMPYANSTSVRKLSKMATLMLARNYIVLLNQSIGELQTLVANLHTVPPAAAAPQPHRLSTQPPHNLLANFSAHSPDVPQFGLNVDFLQRAQLAAINNLQQLECAQTTSHNGGWMSAATDQRAGGVNLKANLSASSRFSVENLIAPTSSAKADASIPSIAQFGMGRLMQATLPPPVLAALRQK